MMPTASVSELLAALVSASVLLGLLVYAARRGTARARVLVLFTPEGEGGREDSPLFSTVIAASGLPGRGLLFSVGLHLAGLVVVCLLPYVLAEEYKLAPRRYEVRIMEVLMPGKLFYEPPKGQAARPKLAKARAVKRSRRPASKPAAAPPSEVATAPRIVWTALLPVKRPSRDVVIQPDTPPDVAPTANFPLPSAFLWAQAPAPLELSRSVGSPERSAPRPFVLPQAQPRIQRPNLLPAIADLQIAQAPPFNMQPQLPVLPANVAPIGLPPDLATPPQELSPPPLPPGAQINLLAIMRNPAPAASAYLLDPSNRAPAPSDAGPGAGAGRRGGTSSEPERAASKPVTPSAKPNSADSLPATAAGRTEVKPGKTPAPPATSPADLLRAASTSTAAPVSGATAENALPPERRLRSAAGRGNLGVIVVRETSQGSGLEGGEFLTGQPVYTVYFDVPGSPGRWIMQYCIPKAQSRSFETPSDGVIRIVPKKSVRPPYPLDRTSLQLGAAPGGVKRLVVYAIVNERGETENIRLVRGAGEEMDRAAVAALRRWSFRPATQGEIPVVVEALFGIPME